MLSIEKAKEICQIEHQKTLTEKYKLDEWGKYLQRDTYLDEKISVLSLLGLDNTSPKRVLDLGAGLGHLGSLCKYFGHSYLGTYFGKTNLELEPFHKDAGLDMIECGLFPRYDKKIPTGPWDCIVVLRTTLDLNAEWTSADWLELKDSCMKELTVGGHLLIKSILIKEETTKYGPLERTCQARIRQAFSDKTPLDQWRYFTYHWIKE
jgi:hypothetical protein